MKNVIGRLSEHLTKVKDSYDMSHKGYDWVVIGLCGSQNYGIDTADSDVDSKCLIIPSMDDLFLGRPMVSSTLKMKNGDHCEVKDIRLYMRTVRKQNINFLEIFFTDYYIVNPTYKHYWDELRDSADKIANIYPWRAIMCANGMIHERYKKLFKPTESKQKIYDKYGYNPKELATMRRCLDFLEAYVEGKSYKECICPDAEERELLLQIKEGAYDKEYAEEYANNILKLADSLLEYAQEHLPEPCYHANELLNAYTCGIMRTAIQEHYEI